MENIYTMKSAVQGYRDQVSRAIMVSAAGDVSTMVWVMDLDQKVKTKYVAFTPNSSAHYPLVSAGYIDLLSCEPLMPVL